MKKTTLIVIAIWLMSSSAMAQVTYAKPEEIKLIKKRPLIVELLELDPKNIEKWEKKKTKSKKPKVVERYSEMIIEYTQFVEDYNNYIKIAVEKHWDLNAKIEYKTFSEVKKLRKSSKTHAVLWFSESSSSYSDEYGFKYFPNLTIPTLNYSRIEKGQVKVDYSFFIPYTGSREKNEIMLGDLLISLKLMKLHLSEIEKLGEKKYNFKKFATAKAKENCSKATGKKLKLPKNLIQKNANIAEFNTAYKSGDVTMCTDEVVMKAIESEDDVIIGFTIPYSIAAGSMGPLSMARILFFRSFIHIKSGDIVTAKGVAMGEYNDSFYRKKEFTTYGVCK
ncbi:MAG: hypothetical protein JKY33_00520 [Bacteroidia bacterium]|nr:hypothetical protein [Bacteroidia bacterium]